MDGASEDSQNIFGAVGSVAFSFALCEIVVPNLLLLVLVAILIQK